MSSAFTTMNATAGPSSPPAAIVHDSPSSSPQIDPFDSFFGYTLSQTSTRDSQHDEYRPSPRFSDISDIAPPPSYLEPPEYQSRQTEPATLAMFLFKFGFLFPLFWVMGACILLSPLRAPSESDSSSSSSIPTAWLPEKTPAERQQIISRLRTVEVKWARRCLFVFIILIVAVAGIGASVWGAMKLTIDLRS